MKRIAFGRSAIGHARRFLRLQRLVRRWLPAFVLLAWACAARAAEPPKQPAPWWLAKNLRVITYEFLERSYRPKDLTADEILACIDRLGGCDAVLLKGFHYWKGQFDDSSWGYPRFRSAAAELIPKLRARGIKVGIFGFTDRARSYQGGSDHDRILAVWREYVRLGADLLFVDEESGGSGLDIPASCLEHCDELRAAFHLPVGLFVYGPASQSTRVGELARHADVIGEMGYELYLQGKGDYRLADLTRRWSGAAKGQPGHPAAYWTGALVFGGQAGDRADKAPGTGYWRERFGERTLAAYFGSYPREALASGADGIFVHSICRLNGLPADTKEACIAIIRDLFREMRSRK